MSVEQRFAALIERRTGIRLDAVIGKRIGAVLRARSETLGHADVTAYLADIERPQLAAELQEVIDLITVGKTSFARYPKMVRAVVDVIVPRLDRLKPNRDFLAERFELFGRAS